MNGHDTGKAWERELELCWEGYRRAGIADIRKVDPPTRMVRMGGGKVVAIPQPNPYLDYAGAWTARHGQAVFLEAKSTQQPRLSIGTDDGIKESQIESIGRWAAAGAISGVLWHHDGGVKAITAQELLHCVAAGARSLKWRHLPLVERGTGLIVWQVLQPFSDRI
jgi:penicillin-binding protein-related factor A (putative recombinase)